MEVTAEQRRGQGTHRDVECDRDVTTHCRCAARATAFPFWRRPERRCCQRGISLVELSVTVALVGATLTLGAPSFSDLVSRNRLATHVNVLVTHLQFARSEAIRRAAHLVMCRSRDATGCQRTSGWHEGWMIFVDADGDRTYDADETLLRVQAPLASGVTITSGRRQRIAFQPIGRTPGSNATFTICQSGRPPRARAVILSNTGRPRLSQTGPDGRALGCP